MKKVITRAHAALLISAATVVAASAAMAANNVTPGLYESRFDSQIIKDGVFPSPTMARVVLAPYAANSYGYFGHADFFSATEPDPVNPGGNPPIDVWPPPSLLYPGFVEHEPVSFMYSGYLYVGEGSNKVTFIGGFFENKRLRIGGHEVLKPSDTQVTITLETGWHKFEFAVDHSGENGWWGTYYWGGPDGFGIDWQGRNHWDKNSGCYEFPIDPGDGSLLSATEPLDYDADSDYHLIVRSLGDYGYMNDPVGMSSFDTAGWWSNGLPPMPGNYIYQVIYRNALRTPANALTNTFEGKILWIDGGRNDNYENSAIWFCGLEGGAVEIPRLWLHGDFMMAGPAKSAALFGEILVPESIYDSPNKAPSRFFTNTGDNEDYYNNFEDRELYIYGNISGSKPVSFETISLNGNWAGVKRNIHVRGDNSGYTGHFIVQASYDGKVTIENENNLGAPSAALTLRGGKLRFDIDGDIAIASPQRVITLETMYGLLPIMEVPGGCAATLACAVEGPGGLGKRGAGRLVLDTDTEYADATIVYAGSLLFNGAANDTPSVDVSTAASIGGTGTVHSAVAFAPGAGIDLTGNGFGAFTLADANGAALYDATLSFDMRGGGDSDSLQLAGPLTLNGACKINLALTDILPPGIYTLARASSVTLNGTLGLAVPNPDIEIKVGADEINIEVTGSGAMNFVWKGNAGANIWDTSAGNWFPASVAYADGMDVIFDDLGVASTPVVITNNVSPGLVVVNAGKNYTFATGANTLSFDTLVKSATGVGKLTLPGNYVVNENIVVENGAGALTQQAGSVISGAGGLLVYGDAVLAGDNTYAGDTVIGVPRGLSASLTLLSAGALGSGDVFLNTAMNAQGMCHKLILGSGVFVEDKMLNIPDGHVSGALMTRDEAGECGWHGDIWHPHQLFFDLRPQHPGATLVVGRPGGENFIYGKQVWGHNPVTFRGTGTVVMNSFLDLRDDASYLDFYEGVKVELCSTNNAVAGLRLSTGTLRLNADNAFAVQPLLYMGAGWQSARAVLDLNGHDLAVSRLWDDYNDAFNGTVEEGWRHIVSAAPATLTINNNTEDSRFIGSNSVIRGPVTLVKNGTRKLTIAQPMGFEGDVGVFVNNGTFSIGHNGVLNTDMTLAVAAGAVVDLQDGVDAVVGTLKINGRTKASGVYGSFESAAPIKHEIFTGTGTLTVRNGQFTLFMVR